MMNVRACVVVALGCLAFGLGGCSTTSGPGYRDVELHSVESKTNRQGVTSLEVVEEAYISFEEVIERSPNVSAVAQVTSLDDARRPSTFDVSPTGEFIVYAALETTGGQRHSNLWRIGARGTGGNARITAGNYYDMDPAFTPDGERIYLASNRNSVLPRIWSVRANGAGGISMLTRGDGFDSGPDVSVDQGRIFYQSIPEFATSNQIWSVDADGGLPTQLTEGEQPTVSPGGTRVLYCRRDSDTKKRKIWVMDADGLNRTQLTSGDSDDVDPAWSPDGAKIVFASNMAKDSNGKQNFDIWLMNVDGGTPTQLTTNGSTDFRPHFAPDGKTVYFLSNRGFNWEIWRMDIIE